jgi:hypothetical protein
MDWTEQKIIELWHLWDKGHSAKDIAEKIGATKNAVISRAHRSGFPGRPSPIGQRGPRAIKPATTLTVAKSSAIVRGTTGHKSPFDNLIHRPVVRVEAPVRVISPTRRCTWTDSTEAPWLWCDAPCEGSWCAEHAKRVWVRRAA